MKSASALSKEIRAKKKAMQDKVDVVDLSGIPMDATDELIMHDESMTKDMGLDDNDPKESHPENEEASAHSLVEKQDRIAEDAIPNEAKMKRMARLRKMSM